MIRTLDVYVHYPQDHIAQILTGFSQLKEEDGYRVVFHDISKTDSGRSHHRGVVDVITDDGKMLVYDVMDGYQVPDVMNYYIHDCDYYFKRSFSREKNEEMFGEDSRKMYPLGFNYLVLHKGSIVRQKFIKRAAKAVLGRKNFSYFTEDKFLSEPVFTENPKIIFCTRLWKKNPEISQMRINILRSLKSRYPDRFIGGLFDEDLSAQLAPDLIIPSKYTVKENYLAEMLGSDICIATTGLHGSIGWKTGEYVAAAKGIVSEKFCYEVPGNFDKGINYLEFETVDGCLSAVDTLVKNPEMLLEMKKANAEYYKKYLQPGQLIKNTLDIVYGSK